MPLRKLIHVVFQNITRSKKNFIFSSIGIIVGITSFTFFIALSQGIQERVLNRIFPIDQLEVEPVGGVSAEEATVDSSTDGIGGVLAGQPRRLDHAALAQLASIEGVEMAFPKMRARFPAKIETGILNRRMAGEGFLEGLEVSDQVLQEMRANEERCSDHEEDICKRREVSCIRDADCPHEGMECVDQRCRPRAYWRSFRDRHSRPACQNKNQCEAGQECSYDRWIILKVQTPSEINAVKQSLAAVSHADLDVDLYVAISEVGAVTAEDLKNAARVQAEIWAVGTILTEGAKEIEAQHPSPIRKFASLEEAQSYATSMNSTLTEGECAGERCDLNRPEQSIGNWKYFEIFENHRSHCAPGLYCAARNVLSKEGRCEAYMPVALNPLMVDFYNSNVVSQLGTRALPDPCLVLGLKGYFRLGFSFLRTSVAPVWQRIRWAEVVGFTDKAMHLGGTTPLPYVERYNQLFVGAESIKYYDSVLLQIPRNELVASIIEAIQKQSFDLSRNSKFARKAGEMLMIVTLTFLLISVIIIVISAMNISHTFLMVVFERQREIGVMRALGASRWDIRKVILAESLLIGLSAGILGNTLSYSISRIVNLLADGLRERFPMIPDDFFIYGWPLVLGSMAFALAFCLIGAWVPANRAAKLDPAVVLSQA